jgi:hypothetical protein
MDGYETLIPGHGVFSAITSSYYSGNHGWKAFNKIIADGGDGWVSKYPEESYTRADGLPNSTASIFYDGVIGEWIQLEFPYSIKLKEAYLYEREPQGSTYAYNTSPRDVRILGKKKNGNNDEWVHLFSVSDLVYTQQQGNTPKILNVNSNEFYSSYVLQLTRIGGPDGTDAVGNGWADVAEWKLFGTPGPTTLDKGSLSLTRSLDVPRVSRYDVDTETPRPEKLVLDFDTTVNSSPTDISGKGNHGVFKGNAVYSAADKAFKFDGEDAGPADYIIGNLNNTGDTDFTVSLWLKKDRSGTYGTLWNFGGSGGSGNPEDSVAVQVTSGDRLDFFIFSGAKIEISNFGVDYLNKWVHIVATRTGIDLKIYLDGVDQNLSITGTAPTHTLQLAANTEYTIGARGTGSLGTNSLSGYISNFKVYDVVLEPSEVKKLYNLGRTGRSMVISDTAVGIGKVPGAQLDVRGNIKTSGMVNNAGMRWFITGNGGNAEYTVGENWFSSNGAWVNGAPSNVYGTVKKSRNGADVSAWDATTGFFTAPEDGIYSIDMVMFINGFDGSRWGGFQLQNSTGGAEETTYTFYTANITIDDTMSYSKTVYMKKGWKFRFYTPQGTVTLYISGMHSSLNIHKIS